MTTLREHLHQRKGSATALTAGPTGQVKPQRLRALVLLSGSVRPTPLSAAIGRSVLDLPIDAERSVMDYWHQQVTVLVEQLQLEHLPVRVMINRRSDPPTVNPGSNGRVVMQVEEDTSEYRGTAGVLRDLARAYDDRDLLLVANGAQVTLEPLGDLFMALAETHGDISIVSHADGTPSSMMLVRCGVLEAISDVGFVDMKEQALPRIAQRHAVTVVDRARPVGLPIRNRADYLLAVRWHHRHMADSDYQTDPFAEAWQPTFGLIEAGAEVDQAARVHDSVVLRGAREERGAGLVQSVVCPGGVVRRNRTVIDRLVEATNGQQKSG